MQDQFHKVEPSIRICQWVAYKLKLLHYEALRSLAEVNIVFL